MKHLILICVAAVALTPHSAKAGGCHAFFRQRVVHHAAVVHHAQPLYLAGADIINESIVRKAVRAELASLQLRQNAGQPVQAPAGVVSAKCARCHQPGGSGAAVFDVTRGVSDYQLRRSIEMTGIGKDVPDAMKQVVSKLTPAEKGELMESLLALPRIEETAADGVLE